MAASSSVSASTPPSSILLLCMLSFWILQTSLPVFHLPSSSISWQGSLLHLPLLSQVLTYVTGLLCCVFACCLLYERSGGRVSLTTNLFFLLFAYAIIYGHGMHAVCVMVEEKGGGHISSSMTAFVDFLHEFVSHHMFMFGIYSLLMLIITVERGALHHKMSESQSKSGKVTAKDTDHSNSPSRTVSSQEGLVIPGALMRLLDFLLNWTWPAIVGVYFSIFACMTGTAAITALFYTLVCTYTIVNCQQLKSQRIALGAVLDHLSVWVTVTKAACVGLPAMSLWLWTYNKK